MLVVAVHWSDLFLFVWVFFYFGLLWDYSGHTGAVIWTDHDQEIVLDSTDEKLPQIFSTHGLLEKARTWASLAFAAPNMEVRQLYLFSSLALQGGCAKDCDAGDSVIDYPHLPCVHGSIGIMAASYAGPWCLRKVPKSIRMSLWYWCSC